MTAKGPKLNVLFLAQNGRQVTSTWLTCNYSDTEELEKALEGVAEFALNHRVDFATASLVLDGSNAVVAARTKRQLMDLKTSILQLNFTYEGSNRTERLALNCPASLETMQEVALDEMEIVQEEGHPFSGYSQVKAKGVAANGHKVSLVVGLPSV